MQFLEAKNNPPGFARRLKQVEPERTKMRMQRRVIKMPEIDDLAPDFEDGPPWDCDREAEGEADLADRLSEDDTIED